MKNDKLTVTSIKALIWSGYLMPLMNVINNLCYLTVAVVAGILYVRGTIKDIGLITTFLLYVKQFTRPFVEIANIYNNFQNFGSERFLPHPQRTLCNVILKYCGDVKLGDINYSFLKNLRSKMLEVYKVNSVSKMLSSLIPL